MYVDIYVLAKLRSEELVSSFLDEIMPCREPAADDYCFPEYSAAPDRVFQDCWKAVLYCCERPSEVHSFYFRNTSSTDPAHAMLFFTSDAGLVVGVSIAGVWDGSVEADLEISRWLEKLQGIVGARSGYALYESPPSCETITEFESALAHVRGPRLEGGELKP